MDDSLSVRCSVEEFTNLGLIADMGYWLYKDYTNKLSDERFERYIVNKIQECEMQTSSFDVEQFEKMLNQ